MTTNALSRRRPLLMLDDDDCSRCSLDDVHRILREAHQSHGLTNGSKFGRSFSMSIDLTSKLAEDEQQRLDDDDNMGLDDDMPIYLRKRSFSTDEEAIAASIATPSVAPSVVRHSSGLSNAVASADKTLAKLEAFLRRDDSHSDLRSFAGFLQSELNPLRNSERELHGLWTSDDCDDCTLDSWKMVGAGVSFVKSEAHGDDFSDVSSMQLCSIAEEVNPAPLHHAANIATGGAAGISFIKDDNDRSEYDVLDVNSIQQLSSAVEHVTSAPALDAMNIANKRADNSAMMKPLLCRISTTNPPELKRLSLTSSTWSCTGSFVRELEKELEEENDVCPYSPTGTDMSFDSSYSAACHEDNCSALECAPAITVPTLESYQESTEHEEDIFYAAAADDEEWFQHRSKTPDRTILDISTLTETSSAARSASVFHKTNVKCESSLMTLLRCADAIAEILYGW